MSTQGNFDGAVKEWRKIIRPDQILMGADAATYGRSTLNLERKYVPAVLFPRTKDEVSLIVQIAYKYKLRLHTVSGGQNYGLGNATPEFDGTVVMHLSQMVKISNYNEQLGLITVEAGVTAGQLSKFLESNKSRFMAPVTGIGPTASVVGNALAHGIGANVPLDRFSSIRAIEAILLDGTAYRSPGLPHHSKCNGFYKWGIGPYTDGLFCEGGIGIVTSVTFELSPRPEYIEAFLIPLQNHEQINLAVESTRNALQEIGSIFSISKLQNDARISTQFSEKRPPWLHMGILQGNKDAVVASRKRIRRLYKRIGVSPIFFNLHQARTFSKLQSRYPWIGLAFPRIILIVAYKEYIEAASGKQFAGLPYVPLSLTDDFRKMEYIRVDDPRVGVILFYGVLPMIGQSLTTFVAMATEVCHEFDMIPYFSIHNFSGSTSLILSLRLIFNKEKKITASSAEKCYQKIVRNSGSMDVLILRFPKIFDQATDSGDMTTLAGSAISSGTKHGP